MRHFKKVEFLAIGDELLIGLRGNGHLTFIGEQLARRGLRLSGASEVPDHPDSIRRAFQDAWSRADLVLVSGGLGPTSDDLTCEVIASALGRGVEHNARVEADIREFFKRRNRTPSANNFKQCSIVEGAEALRNPNGTAPGQWISGNDGKYAVLLPGPPHELQPMFLDQVLKRLEELDWVQSTTNEIEFRTMGMGESLVAEHLEPLIEPLRGSVQIAYCAHAGVVDVRLNAIGDDFEPQRMQALAESCREVLDEAFLGYGQPEPAEIILNHLRANGQTLATAESCTGGLLSSRFTDISGASKVFMGGLVCYRNEAKESLLDLPGCLLDQHGAVSAECAAAMATAVAERMETDFALSVTGFAGPDGGREPAGTVYIGYHSPCGIWCRKEVFPGSRAQVKERAVVAALNFMRLQLRRNEVPDMIESLK